MKNRNTRIIQILMWMCILLYSVAASLVSLNRFWQYEVFYDSFGLFDSVLWQLSRFQMPIIDHLALGRIPVFADHFYPTVFLLTPLFWITSRSEALLLVQVLAVVLSGLVLFLIGKHIIKNAGISLALMIAYLLFIGLQNALITDFHEITIAILPLMLTFWAIATNHKKLYYIFLLLTLGCKETMAFTGIGIGIFLFFRSGWRKHSWFTLAISILWGFITIRLIIPYFSQGVYLYTPQLPKEPIDWIIRLVDDPEKRKTLWYSFQSFLFLPLLTPSIWPLLLQDVVSRFVPLESGTHWTLGMHYNALNAVYLSIASVYGIRTLLSYVRFRSLIYLFAPMFLILNTLILHQFILHGPLGLSYNPVFYTHTKNFSFLNNLIAAVPSNASVMTQSNLAAHLSHQSVYLLDVNYELFKPEYIVVDLRDGQNPNNFFGMHGNNLPLLIETISSDPDYKKIISQGDQSVWQRQQ